MRTVWTIIFLHLVSISFAQAQRQLIDSLFTGEHGLRSTAPNVGLVIGIYHKGQTAYYSFGTKAVNGKDALDSNTVFEIGSATKTFTALLLAEAIQSKKVGLNDYIDNYLPAGFRLPTALRNKVKLTDLASHQSGLPNLSSDVYFSELLARDPRNPFRFVDSAYLYNILQKTDSLHHHGEYQYNNYAFSILGDLLSRIYRKPYATLLQNNILQPLGMKNTSLAIPAHGNVAGLYSQQGVPQDYLILDAVNPAGGLKSNAVDLMKYLKTHLLKSRFSNAISLTRKHYYRNKKRAVGLGWDIIDGYYQKDGDTFGNSMLMRYDPAKQLAIFVLINHQNGQLARDVVDLVWTRITK